MTCGVKIVICWERAFQVFFKPLSKCSWRLSYVFFITFYSVTFESVYDATLLGFMIFVLGYHQEDFDGFTPFEIHLYTMFPANSFYAFTQTFCVGYHYIVSFVDGVGIGTAAFWFLVAITASFGWLGALILFFIQFKAHHGYLYLVRTFCRCSCSSCNCCVVEHTAVAPWNWSHCILQIWYGGCPVANIGQYGLVF